MTPTPRHRRHQSSWPNPSPTSPPSHAVNTGAGQEHARSVSWDFDADHPLVLTGTDNGPTPVEYVLLGLTACSTAGLANIAAARGFTLHVVEFTVEGDIDLQGILGGSLGGPQRLPGDSGQLPGRRRRHRNPRYGSWSLSAEALGLLAVFDIITNRVPVTIAVAVVRGSASLRAEKAIVLPMSSSRRRPHILSAPMTLSAGTRSAP